MKTLREYIDLIDCKQIDEAWFFKSPEEKAAKQAAKQAKQAEYLKSIGFDPNYYNDEKNLSDEEFVRKYGGTKKQIAKNWAEAIWNKGKLEAFGKSAVKDAIRANTVIEKFLNAVRRGDIGNQSAYALKAPWYFAGELSEYPNSNLTAEQRKEIQNVIREIEMQISHWPKGILGLPIQSRDLNRSRELLQSLTLLQTYIPAFFGVVPIEEQSLQESDPEDPIQKIDRLFQNK